MSAIQIEFGRCGFGLSAGLMPEFRVGLMRVTVLSLPIIKELQERNETLRAARDALQDWKRKWGRSETRAAVLEYDLCVSETARQQLELDLHAAVALADERAVTIGYQAAEVNRLEKRLEPFVRVRARDSAGHFVKECVG